MRIVFVVDEGVKRSLLHTCSVSLRLKARFNGADNKSRGQSSVNGTPLLTERSKATPRRLWNFASSTPATR